MRGHFRHTRGLYIVLKGWLMRLHCSLSTRLRARRASTPPTATGRDRWFVHRGLVNARWVSSFLLVLPMLFGLLMLVGAVQVAGAHSDVTRHDQDSVETGPSANTSRRVPATVAFQLGQPVANFAVSTSSPYESSGTVNVRLNLNPAPTGMVTVNYTLSGTATLGDDYTISGATGNGGTIIVGSSGSANIPVAIVNDNHLEALRETVILTIASGVGYQVGTTISAHTMSIEDNDLPGLRFNGAPTSVLEGATTTYGVSLTSRPMGTVTVAITSDNSDVTVNPAQLTFTQSGAGLWSTDQTVTVTASDDTDMEPDSASLRHAASGGGYDGTATSLSVRVTDKDAPQVTPVVSFASSTSSVAEGAATHTIAFDIQNASAIGFDLRYSVGGSASAGGDFRITSANPTSLSGGAVRGTIPVEIVDDSQQEPAETLVITLLDGADYDLGARSTHTVTITDDDGGGTGGSSVRQRQYVYQDPPNFCRGSVLDVLDSQVQAFPVKGHEAPSLRPCSGTGSLDLSGLDAALNDDQLSRQRGVYVTTQLHDIDSYRSRFRGGASSKLHILVGEDENRYEVLRPQQMIDLSMWLIKRRTDSEFNTVEALGRREPIGQGLLVCLPDGNRDEQMLTDVAAWDPKTLEWRILPREQTKLGEQVCAMTDRFTSFILVRSEAPSAAEQLRDAQSEKLMEPALELDPESESTDGIASGHLMEPVHVR